MKLLFDQNISPWLCQTLSDLFPDSAHVRQLGLRDAADASDADFRQRSFLFGHPPKIVWLRVGNCSTKAIEALLRSRAADIEAFLADEQKSFLGLS